MPLINTPHGPRVIPDLQLRRGSLPPAADNNSNRSAEAELQRRGEELAADYLRASAAVAARRVELETERAWLEELEAVRRGTGFRASSPVKLTRATAAEGKIAGYGSVFNVRDSYGDVVMPGAFADSLAELRRKGRSPLMLWMHMPQVPIGVWDVAEEDARGLYMEGQILDTVQAGKEAIALLSAGAVDGLSIGFTTEEAVYDPEEKVRKVKRVTLWEVSLVSFPANDAARVEG